MDDQRWERVKEVFHQALKLSAEDRGKFLEAACGDDGALRAEVEGLLDSYDEIGDDSLSSKTNGPDDGEGRVFPVEGPGSVIGRYKTMQEIGEGGMGVVYLAQQEQPVRRQVALKIIKLGMDTREVIARFEAERQALAIMDHPNIAKVFDAGTTELGRPYFVMEYISGVPITDYCDQQRLNAEERLKLFIPVCHAIHHAHQKGIIHRDVKPSNVLVTLQDGKPVPKVIDFGVAKAVDQRLTEKTFFTEEGVLIGTPVYMSPEQADMTGLNVDTTTDVYSLGALLYELLAGAPPFDPKILREAGLMAIHHMIRDVDPPKPSTRFSGLGDEATTVAERRRTEPEALQRKIRGELDWITMRAMEKDRTRRYQSASEFAADIERYLQDEPIAAGPPTTAYRVRKFVRRHKTGVGLAAAVIVALAGFAVTMTIQANRIARERDRAQFEAKRSRVETELLQAIILGDVPFYRDIYRDGLPDLARKTWEMDLRSLAGNPAALALSAVNLLTILDFTEIFGKGDKTDVVSLRDEIEPTAFSMIEQAVAARDTSILKTVDLMIAREEDRQESSKASELRDAEWLYRESIELRRETLSPRDPSLIWSLTSFANYLEARGRRALSEGRPADAEPISRELLELRLEVDRATGRQSDDSAVAQGLLGECLMELSRYAEAEEYLVESAEILWDARLRLMDLYESWGRPERAEPYRERLLVESVRELGPVGTLELHDAHRCFSGLFEGRSVWVFHRNGGTYGRLWTDDIDASDGIQLYEPGRLSGARHELLSLTPDEEAFNNSDRSVDSGKWILMPRTIVADPERNRALVLYGKVLTGPKGMDAGWSLAVWEHPDSAVVRPVVRPGAEYPTLLFQGDEPDFGAGALADDGYLYLYAANYVRCFVARAPLADVLNRDAWRFYAGETAEEKWAPEWTSAANIATGSRVTVGTLSVHWSEYLQKYLVVSGFPGSRTGGILIHTADRPEGPWLSDELIIKGLPAGFGANRGLLAHPEFARENGRIQYMTYAHPTGVWKNEIRLVEVTFK